jgi:hypothetical protein
MRVGDVGSAGYMHALGNDELVQASHQVRVGGAFAIGLGGPCQNDWA